MAMSIYRGPYPVMGPDPYAAPSIQASPRATPAFCGVEHDTSIKDPTWQDRTVTVLSGIFFPIWALLAAIILVANDRKDHKVYYEDILFSPFKY